MNKPKAMSIFAGGGGLDEGFKAAGYEIVCSIDIEEWACDTLRRNNPDSIILGPPMHSGNVKQMSPEQVSEITGIRAGELDMLMGGPPCQPFSQAASQRFLKTDEKFKRKGFDCQEKGTLLFDFVDYILFFKPRNFLIENVPGLLSVDGGEQLSAALNLLREAGYSVSMPKVVDAVDYGVPQFRQRLIVWGSKTVSKPKLPDPSHSKVPDMLTERHRVVAQALVGIPRSVPNIDVRSHKWSSVERYQKLDFGKREKLGRVDRLDPLRPSKTVIAGGMNGGGRSHLHPFVARTLSVRECARLQSFSDSYEFLGSIARQFTQVGNAVPPLLAEKIAWHIRSMESETRIPTKFKHEKHFDLRTPVDIIVDKLLFEALSEKPEMIYNTHAHLRKKLA
jgi:DNA (cytosine-5)-methyltransferase 1